MKKLSEIIFSLVLNVKHVFTYSCSTLSNLKSVHKYNVKGFFW